jgi:hypothetical protein
MGIQKKLKSPTNILNPVNTHIHTDTHTKRAYTQFLQTSFFKCLLLVKSGGTTTRL